MEKKILLVDDAEGEWQALYIDGEKVLENHSLRLDQVLNAIGIKVESFTYPELEDPDHQPGRFPKKWNSKRKQSRL